MASLTSCSYCSSSYTSQWLHRPNSLFSKFPSSTFSPFTVSSRSTLLLAAAKKKDSDSVPAVTKESKTSKSNTVGDEEEFEEVEEELPWYQEKALDLVEFSGSVTQAIPGPRVGQSSLPWILAVPLAYLGVTFVIAFVKTVRKFNSPKEKRRRQVTKNAILCISVDELLEKGREEVKPEALAEIVQKTGFSMDEILRKYIRYALNEKPFNPELVANLIQLRKASALEDTQVAQVLNEVSRRIEREKGPVVMNMSGYTEKGFKRKLAVQALFGKIFYLSELPEFCSKDSSLSVKEIFGVTDEDAEKLRMHTLSEVGDMDSLQKMTDISDSEDLKDDSPDERND